ncbi:MAG TPA: cytochrome ubiquinol oxidase subunit I [Gemmatimonadaceae bacterium]|nr:cytochrome ubiquinol oxidase subunit I [Gemmatimonadaceae bacterium]
MSDPLFWHRLQFGFTATFHYIFPQLTMGLALLIVILKAVALRTGRAPWAAAARFWIRVFGLSFAMGVVTGVPMEFQFGTNWAAFSARSGAVIGQTLAMEGIFAFFLESSVLAFLLWGEDRLGPRLHFAAAVALFVGSWASGWFIIATNAFMQYPVGYAAAADGSLQLASLAAFVFSPWTLTEFLHNQMASVVTASFAMAATGAFWILRGNPSPAARVSFRTGVAAAFVAANLVAFPTGHLQGRLVAAHQPVTLAAMEGRFASGPRAPLAMIGQPNVPARTLDNPVTLPALLSWIAYGDFSANVRGLDDFPQADWPGNIELLYYAFHIMVGLGTLFIPLMGLAALMEWREARRVLGGARAAEAGRQPVPPPGSPYRAVLWAVALAFPFPFIATTAGWLTAELGRQPWLVYGVIRTAEGASPTVHAGETLFTTLGFAGLYFVLGVLFLGLVAREVAHGPDGTAAHTDAGAVTGGAAPGAA